MSTLDQLAQLVRDDQQSLRSMLSERRVGSDDETRPRAQGGGAADYLVLLLGVLLVALGLGLALVS